MNQEFTKGWHVRDFDRVKRAFDLDGTAKVMRLHNSLSCSTVHKVLKAIQENAVDFGKFVIKEEDRPTVRRIIWPLGEGRQDPHLLRRGRPRHLV